MDSDDLDIRFRWDIDDVPAVGAVMLRGESATGYPTQTWVNGVLTLREPAGVFSWDTSTGVPAPVRHIDDLVKRHGSDLKHLLYMLELEIKSWSGQGESEAGKARCAAYAEYARRQLENLSP
jgi:hypothetical protein